MNTRIAANEHRHWSIRNKIHGQRAYSGTTIAIDWTNPMDALPASIGDFGPSSTE